MMKLKVEVYQPIAFPHVACHTAAPSPDTKNKKRPKEEILSKAVQSMVYMANSLRPHKIATAFTADRPLCCVVRVRPVIPMISTTKSAFEPKSRSRRRGSALVEFALVSGLFLLLLMGIIQYGIYINATSAVVNVARDAARYSSVTNAADLATDQKQVHDHIVAPGVLPPQLAANAIPLGNVVVSYYSADGTTSGVPRARGSMVRVEVSYDMTGKFFMPKAFIGPMLKTTYRAVSSFRIEQGN